MKIFVCQSEPDDAWANYYDDLYHNFNIVMIAFLFLWTLTAIIGFYIVFVYYRNLRKPLFVKAIWILILIATVICLAIQFLGFANGQDYFYYFDWYGDQREDLVLNQELQTVFFGTGLAIHWIFSREYFKVSLKFSLILKDGEHVNTLAQKKKIKCLNYTLSVIFVISVLVWLVIR